jgi:streptogramin lyase
MGLREFCRTLAPLVIVGSCAVAVLGAGGSARAANIVVPGTTDFPESMSASADGTLYFSSFGNGRIWRAKPGETQASEWIKPGSNGTASALRVLADDKSNTLYVCSDDFLAAGI